MKPVALEKVFFFMTRVNLVKNMMLQSNSRLPGVLDASDIQLASKTLIYCWRLVESIQ